LRERNLGDVVGKVKIKGSNKTSPAAICMHGPKNKYRDRLLTTRVPNLFFRDPSSNAVIQCKIKQDSSELRLVKPAAEMK